MTTRPIGAPDPTLGTGQLKRAQRDATRPLNEADLPAPPKLKAPTDANLARPRGLTAGLPAGGPEILAKHEALAAKKLELAKKEMELRAQQNQPKGLWERFTGGVSDLWNKTTGEVNSLKAQVAKLEGEVASHVSDTASSIGHWTADAAHEVAHVATEAAHVVGQAATAVGHGAKAAYEAAEHGDGVMSSLEKGIDTTGKEMATDVLNPMLDQSTLGASDQFKDADDDLGPLLTNRLAIGESASIKIEAGATLPFEALGIPNAKLDVGGTLEIKRVQKTDANGSLIQEPKDALGNPPTELKVTLTVEGRAGAFYSAEAGLQVGADVGEKTVGLNASLRAEAEAGATGKVAYTFSFDPQKKEDMQAMTGMIKATAETGAVAMVPGLGAVLGGAEALRHADDFKAFGAHLESMTGEGGLYVEADASASADLGIFEKNDEDEATGKTQKGYTELNHEETLADQMLLNAGALETSIGADAKVGSSTNYRTGEHTVYVSLGAAANASANLAGMGTEGDAGANRKLAMVYDRDGKLKSVKIEQEVSKAKFAGIRTNVEDIYGRQINPGMLADLGESDSVKISYELKPEHLHELQGLLEGNAQQKAQGVKELASLTITPDNVRLKKGDLVAIHHDTFELGGAFALKLGAVAGVRAKLTLAHGQETTVE